MTLILTSNGTSSVRSVNGTKNLFSRLSLPASHSQAVDDVNQGIIKTQKHLFELKSIQDFAKRKEYLQLVRSLEGYNDVSFPHCACDARRDGHVIAVVSYEAFKLQACREDGTPEVTPNVRVFALMTNSCLRIR